MILLPEIPYDETSFLAKVREIVAAHRFCVVVVGEGLKDLTGKEIGADHTRLDAFGHPVLSGAADELQERIQHHLGLKTRTVKLGYAQRCAAHFGSAVDAEEAVACGVSAVKAAVTGSSGFMPKIVRTSNNPYRSSIELEPLANIANVEHLVPRDWFDEQNFLPNEKFIEYVSPLIAGEVKPPLKNGLPDYVVLVKSPVEKKLPARA
jgi:6-phosphofructokinase 1